MNVTRLDLSLVRQAIQRLGSDLPAAAEQAFERYGSLLLTWNERINLTGLQDWDEIQRRLLVESLALLPWVDRACPASQPCRVIDVGSGAGIPGIPLKIVRPWLHLTLLEATRKKVRFLELVIRELQLRDAVAIHERAENLAHDPAHRGRYDLVTARALAALPTALELTLPFLRLGGLALFPKGIAVEHELARSQRALELLGGEVIAIEALPFADLIGTASVVVVVQVVRSTPPSYPRAPGRPAKRPL